MDQKKLFITDYLRRRSTMAELCGRYNISRKTGYKIVGRFITSSMSGRYLSMRAVGIAQSFRRLTTSVAMLKFDRSRKTSTDSEMTSSTCFPRNEANLSAFKVGRGYRLVMPVAQYFAWKGTNLEGHGQQPTVEVPFSPEEARRGVDNQFKGALDVVA